MVNNLITLAPLSPEVNVDPFRTLAPMGGCNVDIRGQGGHLSGYRYWLLVKKMALFSEKWPFLKVFLTSGRVVAGMSGSRLSEAIDEGKRCT